MITVKVFSLETRIYEHVAARFGLVDGSYIRSERLMNQVLKANLRYRRLEKSIRRFI